MDPTVTLFDGDPAAAPGTAGTAINVACWRQLILYPEVVTFLANSLEWTVEWSYSGLAAEFYGMQVISPAIVPDADPATYTVQYNLVAGGAGLRPALMLPVFGTWVRVRATRVGGAGSRLVIRAEFGLSAAEGLGT